VKGSLWFWGTAYAIFSGILWWIVGILVPIGAAMMLNDHPAVTRLSAILLCLLALYTMLSVLFFRALARSRNR